MHNHQQAKLKSHYCNNEHAHTSPTLNIITVMVQQSLHAQYIMLHAVSLAEGKQESNVTANKQKLREDKRKEGHINFS